MVAALSERIAAIESKLLLDESARLPRDLSQRSGRPGQMREHTPQAAWRGEGAVVQQRRERTAGPEAELSRQHRKHPNDWEAALRETEERILQFHESDFVKLQAELSSLKRAVEADLQAKSELDPPPPLMITSAQSSRGSSWMPHRDDAAALLEAANRGDETLALAILHHTGSLPPQTDTQRSRPGVVRVSAEGHRAGDRAPTLNARDRQGRTVLHCAAQHGLQQLCGALLDSRRFECADLADSGLRTALHYASAQGHRAVIDTLLNHGDFSAFDATDVDGMTALHCAAQCAHVDACLLLLGNPRFGAVDAQDAFGRTALHCCARRGLGEVCQAILRHPRFTEVERRDFSGNTALDCAVFDSQGDATWALLEHPWFFELFHKNGYDSASAVTPHSQHAKVALQRTAR